MPSLIWAFIIRVCDTGAFTLLWPVVLTSWRETNLTKSDQIVEKFSPLKKLEPCELAVSLSIYISETYINVPMGANTFLSE